MIRLKVKEVAQEHGVSISLLARRADMHRDTLLKMLRYPYRMPKSATLEKVAKALGVSPLELLEDTANEMQGS